MHSRLRDAETACQVVRGREGDVRAVWGRWKGERLRVQSASRTHTCRVAG